MPIPSQAISPQGSILLFFLLKWNLLSVLRGVRWCLSGGVLLGSGVSKNLSDGGVWEAVVSLPQMDHLEVFPLVCCKGHN